MRQFVSREYHVCIEKKQKNKTKKTRQQDKKRKHARGKKCAFRVIEEDRAVIAEIAALDRIPEMCRVVCARVCKRQGE